MERTHFDILLLKNIFPSWANFNCAQLKEEDSFECITITLNFRNVCSILHS